MKSENQPGFYSGLEAVSLNNLLMQFTIFYTYHRGVDSQKMHILVIS